MESFLLDIALKATLLLAASFGMRWILRRSSAAARHLLWTVTVVGLLLLPLLSLMLPVRAIAFPSRERILSRDRQGADVLVLAPRAAPDLSARDGIPARARKGADALLLVWTGGFLVVLSRLLVGISRIWWLVRRARPAQPHWNDLLWRLQAQMGVGRTVSLLETDRALPPLTWGLLRPVVLLPAGARDWPLDRLRLVLSHELVHIRRLDFLTQLLAKVACGLFWFHPLAWLAAAEFRKEQERACDDVILAMGTKGSEYAEHLLELARSLKSAWSVAVAMAEPSHLESRLLAMLNPRLNRRALSRKTVALAALVAASIILPLAAVRAQEQAPAGTISGVVSDISNARVPNATVTISGVESKRQEIASTGPVGEFAFVAIPAGHYVLEVRSAGFAVFRLPNIELAPNANVRTNVTLQLGRITETVDVVAQSRKPAAKPVSGGPPLRVRVGGNVQASRLISMIRPVYPERAQEQGIEGTVLLHAVIGIDGGLLSLEPLNTRVDPELTQAALDAVRQWRYQPTLLNGQPVEVVTDITVNFRLTPP